MKWYLLIAFFLSLVTLLYSAFIVRTPVYLNQDEIGFALNAYSISQTGYDASGKFFPLYFWHLDVMWATPIIVYATSIILKFLPFSENTIRTTTIIFSVANIGMTILFAKILFRNKKLALLAGVFLALTPVYFINSRLLLDNIFIVLFVTLWIILLYLFLKKPKIKYLIGIGFVLGIGLHSYHAGKILMPVFLLMSLYFAKEHLLKNKKLLLILFVSFLLPQIPFIPWFWQHPDTLISDQTKYTNTSVSSVLSLRGIIHRVDVWVNFFNPKFLFLTGDESLIHSTKKAGVFLLSYLALLPIGVYSALKTKDKFLRFIIFGFFISPIAAVAAGDHYRISRALVILPFATILSVCAVQYFLSSKNFLLRVICYLLLIAIPVQFMYFLYDYFKDYRIRSYQKFNNNMVGVLEEAILQNQKQPVEKIYLDNIDFMKHYWQFVLIKHQRQELVGKTVLFSYRKISLEDIPPGSLLIYEYNHVDGLKEEIGPFKKVARVFEPDGTQRYYIYRN